LVRKKLHVKKGKNIVFAALLALHERRRNQQTVPQPLPPGLPPLRRRSNSNSGRETKMQRFRVHLPWQLPSLVRSHPHHLRLARRIHASANSGAGQGIPPSNPSATFYICFAAAAAAAAAVMLLLLFGRSGRSAPRILHCCCRLRSCPACLF
jgi:hypothetical protein